MRRVGLYSLVLTAWVTGAALAATPAPNYSQITRTIETIRADWAKPGAIPQRNAAGWNALFEAVTGDLRAYSAAPEESQRLVALNQLYQISNALAVVPWAPAAELRENLREWLRPRVRLAWAERRLVDHLQSLPPAANPATQGNRQQWVKFVSNDLGKALRDYSGATSVAQRQAGLHAVYASLGALQARNAFYTWGPSLELQTALNDLYNQPNLDVSADLNTLSPFFNVNLVESGPVYRKGYWSQVTAGPKTGFGLMPSNDGIAFYNRQMLSSVTPITDFQQQIANDRQGKRAAKMYQFGATSSDQQELTIITVIRTTGLDVTPQFGHNIGLNVTSAPQAGGGLGRAVASLVGFNQPKITQKVWDGAYPQMASSVVQEAAQMGAERTTAEAVQRNAQMRQYLIGYNRLFFPPYLVEGLSLRSQPTNALIGGKFSYVGADHQVGADAPQPRSLAVPESGISADLHLASILSNYMAGYLTTDAAKQVNTVQIVTGNAAPGAPPTSALQVARNTNYATFLQAAQTAQAANDPKIMAVRVKRPNTPPEFATDERGGLVALVRDFQLDVPAPKQAAGGGLAGPPAKVYRFVAPAAEFTVSFKVEPATAGEPLRLVGKVESFDPGPGAKVFAINDDEANATELKGLTPALIYGVFRSKIAGQPINVPLNNLDLRGFVIRSVSPLDPSGWIRVNLDRTYAVPLASAR